MSAIDNAEKRFNKKYPNYRNKLIENFVKDKGKVEFIDWNDLCYIPMAAAIAEITQGEPFPRLTKEITRNACLMAGFAGWIANGKNILTIDELLREKIERNSFANPKIDISAIFEKIGYGTYIDVRFKYEALQIDTIGALVHIEHDVNDDRLELRVQLLDKNQKDFIPFVMHLIDGEDIPHCICDTLNFTKQQMDIFKSKKIVEVDTLVKSQLFNEHSIYAYYINDLIFNNVLGILLYNEN